MFVLSNWSNANVIHISEPHCLMSPATVRNKSPVKQLHKCNGKLALEKGLLLGLGQPIVDGSNLGMEKRAAKLNFTAIRCGGSGCIDAGRPTVSIPKPTAIFVIC